MARRLRGRLKARAQQPGERVRRIGVLMNTTADDREGQARIAAFHQGLQEWGQTLGRNTRIDVRWGAIDADSSRRYATELVALAPEVILVSAAAGLGALKQTTRTVPIVFVNVVDPVGAGYVESLSRPGGNVTGFTPFEYGLSGKWLELLKEVAPIPPWPPGSVNMPSFRRWRRHSVSSCVRSMWAIPAKSSVASWRSRASRTVV